MKTQERNLRYRLKYQVFGTICLLAGRVGRIAGWQLGRPAFIIGTGRCGTSLFVKILKSHSGLAGFPGEANELWHPKLEPFESASLDVPPIEVDPKRFSEISVANWPPQHGERIRDIFTGFHMITGPSKVFFVKSAMISFLIPNLLQVFPDARFIHVYRFGPSVVESYFKKNFGKYSRYAFAEDEYRRYCATYWNACILEIENRSQTLKLAEKGQFLEFSYEYLCANPRQVLNETARFLGVSPDGFKFDLQQISSQNYKVAKTSPGPGWTDLLERMAPGMRLKGYSGMWAEALAVA